MKGKTIPSLLVDVDFRVILEAFLPLMWHSHLTDFRRCSLLTYRFRYARHYRQSGSDRLENQPTDPAAAGRYASYL